MCSNSIIIKIIKFVLKNRHPPSPLVNLQICGNNLYFILEYLVLRELGRGKLEVHNMHDTKKEKNLDYFDTDLNFLTQCFYSHVPPYTLRTS